MKPAPSSANHPLLMALAGLVLSLGLLVGLVGGYFAYSSRQISDAITVIPEADVAGSPSLAGNWVSVLQGSLDTPDEPMNILLLGSDTRQGQGKGFGSVEAFSGARSDTAIFLHLNTNRTRAAAVSIPRDLLVSIPSCTGADGQPTAPVFTRFNAAFDLGGAPCTIATVKTLLGLPVNHVMVIDFRGFQKVIDALGGAEVCLTRPVNDEKAKVSLPAGQQRLTGEQTLGLARARYSIADGSDLSRIVRQQALLRALVRQVADSGLAYNPNLLRETLLTVASALSTDKQLASFEALASLALQLRDLPPGNIEFVTIPWVHTGDGETVSLDEPQLATLVDSLRHSALPVRANKTSSKPAAASGGPSLERVAEKTDSCRDPVL